MADRSLASELESLSRRLWCLRRDNANGFESFSSSQNAFILTTLQTNHELWEDTVLDFEEGHSNSLNDVRPIQQSTTQDENDGGWMGGPSPVPGSFPQNNIALVPGGGRPQSQPIHTSNAMPQATFNQPMPVTQQLNHQAPNANARPAGPPPINGRISPNPMRPKTQQMRNTQSQPNVSQT
ncbi:uncharacterized protein KY384_006461 [Bacidia gigantensis]|uniref:uncharacterized protein n=1 Tax=Bacidia gigantensis TaxID=2732470 RepID=UPI001D04D966|nr:uncharacterized protein KY384_006461 [Bacidia gigantensis]KAG8528773.1 hypothetical protein KY384_006461 [Bacidia gigantensis]